MAFKMGRPDMGKGTGMSSQKMMRPGSSQKMKPSPQRLVSKAGKAAGRVSKRMTRAAREAAMNAARSATGASAGKVMGRAMGAGAGNTLSKGVSPQKLSAVGKAVRRGTSNIIKKAGTKGRVSKAVRAAGKAMKSGEARAIGGVKMGGRSFGETKSPQKMVGVAKAAMRGTGKVVRKTVGTSVRKSVQADPTKLRASRAAEKARRMSGKGKAVGKSADSPQKIAGVVARVGSRALPAIAKGGKNLIKKGKNLIKGNKGKAAGTAAFTPDMFKKAGGSKAGNILKNVIKYGTPAGIAYSAISSLMGGGKGKGSEDASKGAGDAAKKAADNAKYRAAKKNNPKLDALIKERKNHKKGSDKYNAIQNQINKAYGSGKRHGVTETKGTKGRDTVKRKRVPGLSDEATLIRRRKVGGNKMIKREKNLETGTSREVKLKPGSKKMKMRDYDAAGNLTKKTKVKGGGDKVKVTKRGADTVTKIKINKRTGQTRTRTRKKRFEGLGNLITGKRGGRK